MPYFVCVLWFLKKYYYLAPELILIKKIRIMKKVLLFAVVVGGLAFTSCSKSECECTVNGETTTYTEDDVEGGGDLEEGCNALNTLYKAFDDADGCEMK